jgi:hypothetical protein
MAQSTTQDEVKDALAHAEALYYEAKFKDSIALLLRVDEQLRPKPDRLQDKINAKLQLALAYLGSNDSAQAKNFLRELYALDADYSLDPKQFSPKVLTMANDARNEQNEIRCRNVRDDAQKKIQSGQASTVLNILASMKTKCAELAALEPDAAELLYKTGVDAYKRGDFSDAVVKLNAAVKLAPKHELAAQYAELAQSKLQVASDKLVINWQRHFDAREYADAAADYRQIKSFGDSNTQLTQVSAVYRKSLSSLMETWNRACAMGDEPTKSVVRSQIAEILPEPSFGDDILAQMSTCTKAGCVQMGAALAMTRLKVRVNPEISPTIRGFLRETQATVRVKLKIDETGNVTVTDLQGTNAMLNNSIRTAVERWKFAPTIDMNGPRCVETEIPIVVGP